MNKEWIRIAIIDDGVNCGLFSFSNLIADVEVGADGIILQRKQVEQLEISHGTICAAIIHQKVREVKLGSVKVLNDERKGRVAQLCTALDWCVQQKYDLINLSLGTVCTSDWKRMQPYIQKAYEHGILIVAAQNNEGVITYPASMRQVIGVKCYREFDYLKEEKYFSEKGKPYEYIEYPLDGIEFVAPSYHKLLICHDQTYLCGRGNSFAAPVISAMVANLLIQQGSCSLPQMKLRLKDKIHMQGDDSSVLYTRDLSFIQNALLILIGEANVRTEDYPFCVVTIRQISNPSILRVEEELREILQAISVEYDTIIVQDTCLQDTINYRKEIIFSTIINQVTKHMIYINKQSEEKISPYLAKNIMQRHVFLWDGWHYSYKQEKQRIDVCTQSVSCPVIFWLYPKAESSLVSVELVKELFCNDGYECLKYSNQYDCILDGAHYIPFGQGKEYLGEQIFLELYQCYQPDLIFYVWSYFLKETSIISALMKKIEVDFIIIPNSSESQEDIMKFVQKIPKNIKVIILTEELENKRADNVTYVRTEGRDRTEMGRWLYSYLQNIYIVDLLSFVK